MKSSPNSQRIGLAVAIIVGTIGWLAYSGYESNRSYFVTIGELKGMGSKAYTNNLRVEGFVKPGSIVRDGPNVSFQMDEYESHSAKAATGLVLSIVYKGTEPPPDTFKDDSQALAIGMYGRDEVFRATELQAKCASKYAPAKTPRSAQRALPGASQNSVPGSRSDPAN